MSISGNAAQANHQRNLSHSGNNREHRKMPINSGTFYGKKVQMEQTNGQKT
jgi:hypothetical protein